jgi:hypothetical protein
MYEENIQNNLKKIKFIYILFLIFSSFIQIFIIKNYDNILSLVFVIASNLLIYWYCLNFNNIKNNPISTFSLIFTNFYTNSSSIFLKSAYFKPLDENLYDPNKTFLFLFLINFLFIIIHLIYKKIFFFNNLKIKINNIFKYISNHQSINKKLLIYIGLVSLIYSAIGVTFFAEIIYADNKSGPNLAGDIINGIKVFYMAPFIVLYTQKEYNFKIDKNDFFLIFVSLLIVIYLSLGLNSRSSFFDIIFNGLLIYSFLIFTGKIEIKVLRFNKIILIVLLSIYVGNYIEKFSETYIDVRNERLSTNPIFNIKNHLKTFTLSNAKDNYVHISKEIFNEQYYSVNILNRLNVIKATDNILYAKKYLSKNQINNLLDYEIGKMISILPGPLIKIFDQSFDKNVYLGFTLTSKAYMEVDKLYNSGKDNGLVFAILFLYENFYMNIAYFIIVILSFCILDAFRDKENYFILFFVLMYATSGGLINIVTSGSIADLSLTLFRIIPQSLIIFYLFNFFYSKLSR